MKILVVGGHGMIGKEMQRQLTDYDITYYSKSELNPLIYEHIEKIKKLECDVVINLACEKKHKGSMAQTNVEIPRILAENLKSEILFVQISSDYVFDGRKFEKYKSDNETDAVNHYGMTKELGEIAALEREKSMVIRLSWVISEDTGFMERIIFQLKHYKFANVVVDRYGTPTNIKDIPNAIIECMKSPTYRIKHIAGPDVMSWYQIAKIIQKRKFSDAKVFPILKKDYGCEITPEYTALESDIDLPSWWENI